MKRLISPLLCLLLLCGCAAVAGLNGKDETPSGNVTQQFSGILMELSDTSLLVCGEQGLASVSAALPVVDKDGNPTVSSALEIGQSIEVSFSGGVMESYPLQLSAPERIRIKEESNGLISMYLKAFDSLLNGDSALMDDAAVLGYDFSKTSNLTEGERAALGWVLAQKHGLEPVAGTYEELCEQDYIDADKLWFENGMLLRLGITDMEDMAFDFSVSVWRSGDGAVGIDNCKAKMVNGVWSYEPGESWIS